VISFKQFLADSKAKYTLDRFYDRSIRSWTVLCKDEDGNQVGDAVHVYSRGEAIAVTLADFELPKDLDESISKLYKRIDDKTASALAAGKSMPVKRKFTSFVKDPKYLKSEFGNTTVVCDVKDLPKGTKVVEIQYDLAWFTASPLRKELLMMVTSRDEEDWIEEFGDVESVDNELESLYGDEHEVVVIGLNSFDPQIFKVLK